MYDLPSEYPEEPGLPDQFHLLQPQLLRRTLRLNNYSSDNYLIASNLNLYYDVNHILWHKRPDWFLAVDVPYLYDGEELRWSYVVWQEGKSPYVVIELLSPGTEVEDLGRFYDETSKITDTESAIPAVNPEENISQPTATKFPTKLEVYEKYLQVPHYIVYSRYTQKLRYFKWSGGQYQEQSLNLENPMVWLADLEIGLGIWEGVFENVPYYWLRWCDRAGNWRLTDIEQSEQRLEPSEQRLEQERAAKEQAEAKLMQAARNLMETGMEIEEVAQILGLSEVQLKALQS
ncbi:MAG: Uma2 family endonuclease [Symploca sp. SIO3E6]|nr:Uma2 family endonuclease [Caldora sp. SIO3E6]